MRKVSGGAEESGSRLAAASSMSDEGYEIEDDEEFYCTLFDVKMGKVPEGVAPVRPRLAGPKAGQKRPRAIPPPPKTILAGPDAGAGSVEPKRARARKSSPQAPSVSPPSSPRGLRCCKTTRPPPSCCKRPAPRSVAASPPDRPHHLLVGPLTRRPALRSLPPCAPRPRRSTCRPWYACADRVLASVKGRRVLRAPLARQL